MMMTTWINDGGISSGTTAPGKETSMIVIFYQLPKAAEAPRMIVKAPDAPTRIKRGGNFIDINAAIKNVFWIWFNKNHKG